MGEGEDGMTEEQRELMRIAAQSALAHSRNGRDLKPDARQWAMHWAAMPPLGRPVSSGDPAAETLPDALRGGALEVF
jgi:hypothetical protein